MNEILAKQLAIDFCTDIPSVFSKENIFTEYKPIQGRRIFREGECFLKVASVNGKILASGKKEIIEWAQEKYKEVLASGKIDEILDEGAKRASYIANKTLNKVKKTVGLYVHK